MSGQFVVGRIFVLGARDSEMLAIEQLLALAGEKTEFARVADGTRVNLGTAYKAVSPAPAPGQVWVECANGWPTAADAPLGVTVVDHHRDGDPGFGLPPEQFWEASSIGQVFEMISRSLVDQITSWRPNDPDREVHITRHIHTENRIVAIADSSAISHIGPWPECRWGEVVVCGHKWPVFVSDDGTINVACDCDGGWSSSSGRSLNLKLVAAGDHCLAAAYAGKCPGVKASELFAWWLESISKQTGKTTEELEAGVLFAGEKLLEAPEVPDLAGVLDLRPAGFIPNLPAAAVWLGAAYLTIIVDRDERTKIVLGGCGEGSAPGTEPVKQFISEWGPSNGLLEIYGDPVRGYAGGYLPKKE